ncbi:ASCH domain-containing protein [Alkalicoccus daliensis]|uniref:Uncharacterized protein YhfF n=1 Tax=Alkalicoccus daliensis TaxID=745820 RepID=A0A1H0D8U0_9BACI|nr:ASCH domain-containing protein [Alkalicoccus daliensis]SDN66489.1 Uncharacterized protein YhfF [Alkalicoccus daliensis]
MNQKAQTYWNEFWQEKDTSAKVTAEQFGAEPDYLAQLVIEGTKTATCSGHIFYEIENEPLPEVGQYMIVLNSEDQPVAIIQTTEVTLTPMNQVSEEFAEAEGEGDKSYQYWWDAHESFFRSELEKAGKEFSEEMLLVCERFQLVDVKE